MGIIRIGFDLDEVLIAFLDTFLPFYNARHNTGWKKDDFFSYDFDKVLGIPLENIIKDIYAFHKTALSRNMPAVDGAEEGIAKLKGKADLYVITGRQLKVKSLTEQLVEKNFNGSFKDVLFANYHTLEGKQQYPKPKICRDFGIKLMVEDLMHYAIDISKENDIPVIVPRYNWNKNIKVKGTKVSYAQDWPKISDKIEKYLTTRA